jgi:hypothetical protein
MNNADLAKLLRRVGKLEKMVEDMGTREIPLETVGWTDYSAISTVVGWSAFVTKKIYYKCLGKLALVSFYLGGTSNATTASFTLPYAIVASVDGYHQTLSANIIDNGSNQLHPGLISVTGAVVSIYLDAALTAFTNSGNKYAIGQFWYPRA